MELVKRLRDSLPAVIMLAAGLVLISPILELSIRHFVAAPSAKEPTPETENPLPLGWSKFVTLVDKFGEALIIAGALALAFEQRARTVVLEEVSRDAINVAVGWDVPPDVKSTAMHILKLPFERRGFVQHYEFHLVPVNSPRQYLAVTSTTEYELTNLTNAGVFFDFKSSVEICSGKGLPENELLLMKSPDESYAGNKLDQLAKRDGPYKKALVPVWIPARGHAKFLTRRLAHYERNDDLVLDILEPPAIGMKVTIEAPAQFQFRVSFGATGVPKPSRPGTRWEWEHPGVFLPGSHFRIQWEEQT